MLFGYANIAIITEYNKRYNKIMKHFNLGNFLESHNDVTQEDVAQIIGASQPFVSLVKKGKRGLNEDMIDKLRKSYNDIDSYITDVQEAVVQHNEHGDNVGRDKVINNSSEEITVLKARLEAKESEIMWLRGLVEKLTLRQ